MQQLPSSNTCKSLIHHLAYMYAASYKSLKTQTGEDQSLSILVWGYKKLLKMREPLNWLQMQPFSFLFLCHAILQHILSYNSYDVSSGNLILDQIISSHHLSACCCLDMVMRNSVLVIHGSERVNIAHSACFQRKKHCWSLQSKYGCYD